jgi:RNA polymerase sigma-70 factor, ECF subfamily
MDETRQSLLIRAQAGETDAWKDLVDLYRPLILSWLNRQGVPPGDLDDLSQEVLLSGVKYLPGYEHSGNRGAFLCWLRTIVCSRMADYWREIDANTQAQGGSGATAVLQEIADPDSTLVRSGPLRPRVANRESSPPSHRKHQRLDASRLPARAL